MRDYPIMTHVSTRAAARLSLSASMLAIGLAMATPAAAESCLLDTDNNGVATPGGDGTGGAQSVNFDPNLPPQASTASLACGPNAQATGVDSAAIGSNARSSAAGSSALGSFATATGTLSTAIGFSAQATQTGAVAIGGSSRATGLDAIAIGRNAPASGLRAIAIGTYANNPNNRIAGGEDSIAVGTAAGALANSTIAIGAQSVARLNDAI